MNLLEIHHVQITIPKGSEDEGRQFYCGLLGLREIPKPEALAGRGGFWLELHGKQIHVGTENGIDYSNSKAHIAYLVDDLGYWQERLTKEEIEIIGGIPIPGYRRIEFRDPFGNRVEFLQVET